MNVLVCGYGLIGAQRVQPLTRNASVSSISVCDPKLQDGLQLTTKAASIAMEDAVREQYDAALIATPHDTAVTLLPQVAKVSPTILVEKPLGRNAGETERLLADIADSGSTIFTGLNYRQLKNVQHARRLLASGELGRVLSVDAVLSHGAQPGYESSWKTDPVRCGGGVCLDPGIHVFDLFCWLFGGAELAGGLLKVLYWPIQVEDHASLIFNLPDGAMASVVLSLSSWKSRFEMTIETDRAQILVRGRGKFYGPQQLIVVAKWPWLCPPGTPRETEYNYGQEDTSLQDETDEFIAAASGRKIDHSLASAGDALRAIKLVDACYRLPSTPPALRQLVK
jgi:predicted dehydrogenase